MLVASFYRAWN